MPDPMPPAPATVDMSAVTTDGAGYMAPAAGRLVIVAGMSETSGDVTFTCAAGGADCEVTIAADGTATSTGGMVTAMDSAAYTTRLADAAEEQRQMDVAMARSNANEILHGCRRPCHYGRNGGDSCRDDGPGLSGSDGCQNGSHGCSHGCECNAKAAHDAIMDGMTKAEADAQAAIAATEAGKANTAYMTAKAENDAIQTARDHRRSSSRSSATSWRRKTRRRLLPRPRWATTCRRWARRRTPEPRPPWRGLPRTRPCTARTDYANADDVCRRWLKTAADRCRSRA